MALFDPQGTQCLDAAKRQIEFFAGGYHRFQKRFPETGGGVNLVTQFSGKGDADHADRQTRHGTLDRAHELQSFLREIDIADHAVQQIPRLGAGFESRRGANGHRSERRTKSRHADIRNRLSPVFRNKGKCDQIGALTLIGSHTQSGVTFEMLDRHMTFAIGRFYIRRFHIVLEIDEGLVRRLVKVASHFPNRL